MYHGVSPMCPPNKVKVVSGASRSLPPQAAGCVSRAMPQAGVLEPEAPHSTH